MRVFGVWYGGSSCSLGDLLTDCESWASLRDAKITLVERYEMGSWRLRPKSRVVNFDQNGLATLGEVNDSLFPAVNRELTCIDLYRGHRVGDGRWRIDPESYARLTLGPRGGVRVERL